MTPNSGDLGVSVRGLGTIASACAAGTSRSIADALVAGGSNFAVFDESEGPVQDVLSQNPGCAASVIDVSDRRRVESFFDKATAAFDGLNVRVSNAGIARPEAKAENTDPAVRETTIAINLNRQFPWASSYDMAAINVVSVTGRIGAANRTLHVDSKWAIVEFTESVAFEMNLDGAHECEPA